MAIPPVRHNTAGWSKGKRQSHGRIQGRAGVALRTRRLANEPLCRLCKAKGLIVQAETVDHIQPLSEGGTDTDDNCQSLCWACHDAKTAGEIGERFTNGRGSTHPDWLRPSAIPLTIVCGPPASGKTTYVAQNAYTNDTVIDLDAIMAAVVPDYQPWEYGGSLDAGLRQRNAMLGDLSRATKGKAWFIVSAPSQGERRWWKDKLGGQIVLLNPGEAECKRRCMARGTPKAKAGVDRWFRNAGKAWSATPKQAFGADGWPTGGG